MKTKEYSLDGKDILAELEIDGETFYGILTNEKSVSIPIWIFTHKDLSDRSIRIWGYLKGALNGSFGIKGTSHKALADLLNICDKTVRRAIYELRDVGAITIQPRHRNGKQVKSAYYLWPAEAPGRVDTDVQAGLKRPGVLYNNDIDINISKEQIKTRKKREVVTYPDEFAKIWDIYPRKIGKGKAFVAFNETLSTGKVSFDDLLKATINYAEDRRGKSDTYTLHASTFFGSSKKWEAYLSGSAPDVAKFVMTAEQKISAKIYDDYDSAIAWTDPKTNEVLLDNPLKHGYSRPINNLGQSVDQNGMPYALDSASGERKNI